ncbi:MAG TPA: GAF domain-containing sensor histidine kinase [Spirochaetota bacterium]|nr:GAF domain-containing sensor histidine kinase [Spirochaetota bacterium]HPI88817.1 GAF domain-containing sensor histidine kinase [Spirochaetota bacterium]HPR47695.1 GAF domain-containing sensor histidine kinase [Spirochaetota bacterium]
MKKQTNHSTTKNRHRIIILAVLILISLVLIYYFFFRVKGDSLFSHFFYVPIILSALWWQRRGIFVAIFLALLLVLTHIYAGHLDFTLHDTFRGIMFVVTSTTVAFLSERMIFNKNAYLRAGRALRVYSACNKTIVFARDENRMLSDICDIIVNIGGYRLAWVGFKEPLPSKAIKAIALAGYAREYIDKLNITWDDTFRGMGPSGRAVRTGNTAISHDTTRDPLFEPWRELAMNSGLISVIALPLRVKNEVIGVLGIYAPEPDAFDRDEEKLLTELADDLSFGIKILRARVEQQAAEEALTLNRSRLQALLQLNQMNDLGIIAIKDYVLEETVRLTKSEIGYLAFVDDDEKLLKIESWSKGVMERCSMEQKPMIFPLDRVGLWGQAAIQKKPVITNDYPAPQPGKTGLPTGHVAIIRHMSVPLLNEKGDVLAIAGVANKETGYDDSDVTQITLLLQEMWKYIERRKTEEELAEYRAHLEELVQVRTAELQESNDLLSTEIQEKERLCKNLEDKTRELDSFVHTASHDLKAPLVILGGYTDRIIKTYKDILDSTGLNYLELLRSNVNRMEKLIHDLLELSRVGRVAGDEEPVNIEIIIDEIRKAIDPVLREKNITLRVLKPLPWVLADRGRIMQIFENLITNAVKFMGPQPDACIEIGSAGETPELCTFYVRDNGIGIDPSQQEIVFKEFHRLKEIEADGTGIGLAIVKKITEHYNGRIWIESAPDRGSIFYVELPAAGTAVPKQSPGVEP